MSVLAMMLLFVALQPGLLLTLPAVGRSVFMSRKMSVQAVMVHALIFALVVHFFRSGGYFEGFAAVAPSTTVVKETEAFINELNATIKADTPRKIDELETRLNAIDKRVNTQIASLKGDVARQEDRFKKQYSGSKPVSVSMKATLDKSSADIAKKKAEIALYEPVAAKIPARRTQINAKRAEINAMLKKTIASASASLPPAVVSQLKQSASQLSTSQIAALQKVVTASASPSTILASVKSIVPSIAMPSMISGSMMSSTTPMMSYSRSPMMSGSMMSSTTPMMSYSGSPMMSGSRAMSMMSGSMPTSLAQAQALAAKYGFNI